MNTFFALCIRLLGLFAAGLLCSHAASAGDFCNAPVEAGLNSKAASNAVQFSGGITGHPLGSDVNVEVPTSAIPTGSKLIACIRWNPKKADADLKAEVGRAIVTALQAVQVLLDSTKDVTPKIIKAIDKAIEQSGDNPDQKKPLEDWKKDIQDWSGKVDKAKNTKNTLDSLDIGKAGTFGDVNKIAEKVVQLENDMAKVEEASKEIRKIPSGISVQLDGDTSKALEKLKETLDAAETAVKNIKLDGRSLMTALKSWHTDVALRVIESKDGTTKVNLSLPEALDEKSGAFHWWWPVAAQVRLIVTDGTTVPLLDAVLDLKITSRLFAWTCALLRIPRHLATHSMDI